ncbi:hypothetical protein Bhyg_03874 [Pseudolycoriella hygida]|uniref:Uncharacterized protein n=1 Tax=Pseudolycoriella hygida TaxID=35572 RepID=A0A9Q0NEF1_9DIPT|nr:hypothetical protein Bhyg_03874 [Pseudolycoriella hygida]
MNKSILLITLGLIFIAASSDAQSGVGCKNDWGMARSTTGGPWCYTQRESNDYARCTTASDCGWGSCYGRCDYF